VISKEGKKHVTHLQTVDCTIPLGSTLTVRQELKESEYPRIDRTDFHLECFSIKNHDTHEYKMFFKFLGDNKKAIRVSAGKHDIVIKPPQGEDLANWNEFSKLECVGLSPSELVALSTAGRKTQPGKLK